MLTETEILTLIDRLGTPPRGRKLVLDARKFAPVRKVKSRGGNVITYLASRKMQREIATESRHIEFAAAAGYEFDSGVLEYYPQPSQLKLDLVEEDTGEIHTIRHTPDFLVIYSDKLYLDEWKTEASLERLSRKYPWRYRRTPDGGWYAPLIERELAKLGIAYRVRSQAEISQRWVENIIFLEDYLHPAAEPCPEAVLWEISAVLKQEQVMFLAELFAEPLSFKPDDIFKGVADGLLVADLEREALSDPRRCRLYRDQAVRELVTGYVPAKRPGASYMLQLEVGQAFAFDGRRFEITLVGDKNVVLTDSEGRQTEVKHGWLEEMFQTGRIYPEAMPGGDARAMLSNYDEAELGQALWRRNCLSRESGASERTLSRWRNHVVTAQVNGVNEVLALVPKTKLRGNRTSRLTQEQIDLIEKVIREHWLTAKAVSYRTCDKFLKDACADAGVTKPSYPTLISKIKAIDLTKANRARHGKRVAYQEGDFVYVLHVDTPVHGSRPLQYCHIDHTQLDMELICSLTGKNLGKPWLSIAIDACTRRIIGIYLTFDSPSYRSTMMVLRDIVRRYGRLPQFIIADNGSDFRSEGLRMFLEAVDVHMRFRPAGRPRHGAVMERIFGRVHSEYVHNLAGNTKAMKKVRMTTGKFLPSRLAEWTLESMYYGLEYWAFEYYDQEIHPALKCSPREAFERGIAQSGSRAHRQIVANRDFMIATCPSVDRKGLRKVDRQRGVKVDGYFYWAPEFRDIKLAGTLIPVKTDPWDASSAYAKVNNRWVRCLCKQLAHLGQMTEVERQALTTEYQNSFGKLPDTPQSRQRLKEFLQIFTPEGAVALALERQGENKALYGRLHFAAITPETPWTVHMSMTDIEPARDQIPVTPLPVYPVDDLTDFDTF